MAYKLKLKVMGKKATSTKKKKVKSDNAVSYDEYKQYDGKQYTGMPVGKSHKWYYDKGEWKETKITPDLWQIFYSVTKRRAGKAPKGSGAPVGTGYHWYILAHQNVFKLNANDYSTTLSGLKYKVAHKRAAKGSWSSSIPAQRKHLIAFFKKMIEMLEHESTPLMFEYNGEKYKGEAIPILQGCNGDMCLQYDINLNGSHIGIIRYLKSGWKMEGVEDKKFIKMIGQLLE